MIRDNEPSTAQLAEVPAFVAKWTKIGLSATRVDRQRAERDLVRFYQAAHLAEPVILWLPCPMTTMLSAIAYARIRSAGREREMRQRAARAGFVARIARELTHVNQAAQASVEAAVERALGQALRLPCPDGFSTAAAAGAARRAALGFIMSASLERTLLNEIWAPLRQAVDGILDLPWRSLALVEHMARDQLTRAVAGAGFGGRPGITKAAQLDYANRILGVPIDRSFIDTMQSCGWYWVLDGLCFAAERFAWIKRDAMGRPHSEAGPSVAYRSGWSWWHWHGFEVPQYVIDDPAKISLPTIEGVNSPELRRILIERYRHGEEPNGAAAFLCYGGARRLDHDETFGTLWRRDLDRDEPLVMVEVVNGSPEPDGSVKRYFLRVDPQLRPILPNGRFGEPQKATARNAVASTFGLSGAEYAPEVET
jgi:hypothetical protein